MTASVETITESAVLTGGRLRDASLAHDRAEAVAPARADGVQLLGEMAGSGYHSSPALVQRADGQTIQLTPLLYQLLDLIDGSRTEAELAEALSERCGKLATAEDVRFLMEAKLRPLGVLRAPDGSQPIVARANPLLALRLKLIVSSAAFTNRIASLFAPLFHWPIAAAALVAFAAATWWIGFEKGLASAAHNALYEPAQLLLVLGLVLFSTAFHEVGHAAACRFGGARPGPMGVGLYLVWPAFYTDVSESYRLDRVGRLRVDLGGLYFNAIFGVAIVGLWAAVRWDALLLVVVAQLFQMVRQLIPFVRFDGYHVLADLVGVPDLFHHIKPTLRRLLPSRRRTPSPLKAWARAVVTTWVLVTVPLLLAMLLLIILILPRIVGTAWDSLALQWDALAAHWDRGEASGTALGIFSLVTVSLPVLGIAYLLTRVTRGLSRGAWRATAGRPIMRTGALLCGGLLLAGLTFAWWPGENYRPIKADEQLRLTIPFGPSGTGGPFLTSESAQAAAAPAASAPGRWMVVVLPREATAEATASLAQPTGAVDFPAAPPVDPRPEWPFPFDPPAAPEEGDNQALAVNTEDGASIFDSAIALVWVTDGGPVDQTNEAYALASCWNCETTAVSFQVVVVIGYAQVVTPENAAVALNYVCVECLTQALAIQTVVMLDELPDEAAMAQLNAVWNQLEQLSESFEAVPLEDVYAQLVGAQTAILDILGGEGIAGETGIVEGSEATTTSESTTTPAESGTATTGGGAEGTTTTPSSGDTTTTGGGDTTTTGGDTTTSGTTTGEETGTTAGEATPADGTTTSAESGTTTSP
jgi:putative peptide zinc metalloprotease protein